MNEVIYWRKKGSLEWFKSHHMNDLGNGFVSIVHDGREKIYKFLEIEIERYPIPKNLSKKHVEPEPEIEEDSEKDSYLKRLKRFKQKEKEDWDKFWGIEEVLNQIDTFDDEVKFYERFDQ